MQIKLTFSNILNQTIMLSFISKLANPNRHANKIHPESPRIDTPRTDTPRADPCSQIYARHKEPGAYDQYRQTLLLNKV